MEKDVVRRSKKEKSGIIAGFVLIIISIILLFCAIFRSRPINILRILFYLESILLIFGYMLKFFRWTEDTSCTWGDYSSRRFYRSTDY